MSFAHLFDQLPLVLQQLILEHIDSFDARAKACCVSKAWRKDAARWIAHATREWPGELVGQPLATAGLCRPTRIHTSPYFTAGTLLPPYWSGIRNANALVYGVATAPATEADARAYCRARCASEGFKSVYRHGGPPLAFSELRDLIAGVLGGTPFHSTQVPFFGVGSLGRRTTGDVLYLLKQVAPDVELTDAAGALLNDFLAALARAFASKGTDVLSAIDELIPDSDWLREEAQAGNLMTITATTRMTISGELGMEGPSSRTLFRAVEAAMVDVLERASQVAIEEQRTTVAGDTFVQKVLGAEPIARLLDSDPAWGQIRPSLLGGRHAACETWEATLAFPIPLGSNNAEHLDVMREFQEEYPTDEENDYVEGDPNFGIEDAVSRIACALMDWGAESIRAVHFHPDCDSNNLFPTLIVGELPGPALCGFAFIVNRQD